MLALMEGELDAEDVGVMFDVAASQPLSSSSSQSLSPQSLSRSSAAALVQSSWVLADGSDGQVGASVRRRGPDEKRLQRMERPEAAIDMQEQQPEQEQRQQQQQSIDMLAAVGSDVDAARAKRADSIASSTTPSTTLPLSPRTILPTQQVIPLRMTGDGLHFTMKLRVGSNRQTVHTVIDTGTADLLILSSAQCADDVSMLGHRDADGVCFNDRTSTSTAPNDTSTAVTARYSISIDGEIVSDNRTRLIDDTVELDTQRLGQSNVVSPGGSERKQGRMPIMFSNDLVRRGPLHFFNDSGGSIGLAYAGLANKLIGRSPFLQLLNSQRPMFALDLNDPNIDTSMGGSAFATGVAALADGSALTSEMHLEGIAEKYRDHLVWSERQPTTHALYHDLAVYDMSLCGANLMQGRWNALSALVDTGAACLTLPAEMFDSVLAWVPAECTEDFECYLPLGTRVELPVLSFRVSVNGPLLHLPLRDLLVRSVSPLAKGRLRWCIVRGSSVGANPHTSYFQHVSFGTRALLSLYTVLSMDTGQVGFANKRVWPSEQAMQVQCKTAKRCIGMQQRMPALNACLDPSCSDYYFFELDYASRTCRLSSAFHVVAVLFIVLFVGGEVLLQEARRYLLGKIETTVRSS
eukprot:TRINITY_DN65896_c13_g5_i1.p1 TRINITY_DN65896_c13_g5~~TRINITY_DN65896_c13_g5_i1.p1  ORF type:complete len:703 (-),score=375.75 TRINITY_DN65896_c13_g5_i1:80-1984(-)